MLQRWRKWRYRSWQLSPSRSCVMPWSSLVPATLQSWWLLWPQDAGSVYHKHLFQTLVTPGECMKCSREALLSPSDVLQQGKLTAINLLSLKEQKVDTGWWQPVAGTEKSPWEICKGWWGETLGWAYGFAAIAEAIKNPILVSGCTLGIQQSIYPAEWNCWSSADFRKNQWRCDNLPWLMRWPGIPLSVASWNSVCWQRAANVSCL